MALSSLSLISIMYNCSQALNTYGERWRGISKCLLGIFCQECTCIYHLSSSLNCILYKPGKACGVDGIPSECLLYAADNLDSPLMALFNYVFDNGEYPDEWAEGIINPIHKTGPFIQPDNYRKITVLNALGKLFETVLNSRLNYLRQVCKQEDPFQNGFKNGCSTIDNDFILNGIIEKHRAINKPLYICYIDFKSAFDFVSRHALLFKLLNRGVKGKMLRIL